MLNRVVLYLVLVYLFVVFVITRIAVQLIE